MGSGSPEASSRSEVAEWEEPRHPGPAVRARRYPTMPHSATQFPSFVPQSAKVVRSQPRLAWKCSSSAVGRSRAADACGAQDRVHIGALHEELQSVVLG